MNQRTHAWIATELLDYWKMRVLSDYKKGLQMESERHWSKEAGTFFEKENILISALSDYKILNEATSPNLKFGITFNNRVPNTNAKDIRDEIVSLYWASFAIVSIIAPLILISIKLMTIIQAHIISCFIKSNKL